MKKILINRFFETGRATFGRLMVDDFSCFTLELPDRRNQVNISRILPGVYGASIGYGYRIDLEDKNGRSFIQIHPGNYISEIRGCILVGRYLEFLEPAVFASRDSMRELMLTVEGNSFVVEVRNEIVPNLILAKQLVEKFEREVLK